MGPFYSYPVQASKSGPYLIPVSPPKPALSSKISPSTSFESLPEMAALLNSQSLISPPKPTLSSSFQFVPSVRISTSSHVSRTRFHCTVRKAVVIRAAATDREFSSRRSGSNEPRETIMLPGCDYNHWLIVMEFPKDPAPSREQMIETYLNTLATVLGSIEEAKKNMYAFSTTTYTGFQCTVDEETSEKFKGLPGVLWVLPDSYIDVKNKDYGGDKYINGEIIPCQYPTYQPKQRRDSKYVSKKYERRRDGPPPQVRSRQEATQTEPVSE